MCKCTIKADPVFQGSMLLRSPCSTWRQPVWQVGCSWTNCDRINAEMHVMLELV
jgi:hypothetical protein